jgi:hypothetical protein
VSDWAELSVIGVDGQEVGVDRKNVRASCFGKHHFESLEPFAVPFKGVKLSLSSSDGRSFHEFSVKNLTFPLFFMRALRCDVLLPGAAVASITTLSSVGGGERTSAGKQEALS